MTIAAVKKKPDVQSIEDVQSHADTRQIPIDRVGVKNIGKPCAEKLHARFDEGGQVRRTMARLLRHRQTKGGGNRYAWSTERRNLFSTLL